MIINSCFLPELTVLASASTHSTLRSVLTLLLSPWEACATRFLTSGRVEILWRRVNVVVVVTGELRLAVDVIEVVVVLEASVADASSMVASPFSAPTFLDDS